MDQQGQAGIIGAEGQACARPSREAEAGQWERADTVEAGQARSEADGLTWTRHVLPPCAHTPDSIDACAPGTASQIEIAA